MLANLGFVYSDNQISAQPTAMANSPPLKRRRQEEIKGETDSIKPSILQKLSPAIVFAHGAGVPSTSDWMIRWKKMLEEALHAVEVVTFDYPYISGGKKRAPPKAEKLVDFHAGVVQEAVARHPGHPLILAGKSMGSRVSCMVASHEDITVSAVICLGYPLKGSNGAIRDEILIQLDTPVMFVQGSKDGLCPLNKLDVVREKLKAHNVLHVIEGGDHSFKIGKKNLQEMESTQEDAEETAVHAIATFVAKVLGRE